MMSHGMDLAACTQAHAEEVEAAAGGLLPYLEGMGCSMLMQLAVAGLRRGTPVTDGTAAVGGMGGPEGKKAGCITAKWRV